MLTESPNSLFNCQRPRRFRPRAASSGPREPGEVTHPRSSRQELFSTFEPPLWLAVSRLSACGGAFLRSPVRPVNTFFQLCSVRFRVRNRASFSRSGGGYLPDRFRPVNTYFFKSSELLARPGRASASRSGGVYLPILFRPVNSFFQLPRSAVALRCPTRLSAAGRVLLGPDGRPVKPKYSLPTWCFPKRHRFQTIARHIFQGPTYSG